MEHVQDFRPISLSNSIYLIIAKVLANRLRKVLPPLISPLQCAFLPGRQMADSIVLAEEIVAAWRRNGTTGFMWKVDFSEAYDTLDWQFLWNVLRRQGFPETWVRWMKQCVTVPQGGPSSLKAVLAAIPIYFMSIFRMPVGVRRRLERSMRDFFWRGPLNEESREMALVPWETLCRPVDRGGLGVRQLIHTNTALLSKWVSRILHPTGELVTSVLRDEYGHTLDWQLWQTPRRGDSAFLSSLRPIFQAVRPFFRPRLGSGKSFRFWFEDWSRQGSMSLKFPRLFALARDQQGPVC